jgi:3-deoxy-D-manno-octulosonic-acid transferase
VAVIGNCKFDGISALDLRTTPRPDVWREAFVWVGGSTHPGEEVVLLEAHQAVRARHPHLRLILAPRHIERAAEVMALVKSYGLEAVRFSTIDPMDLPDDAVLVMDEIGHLLRLYAWADAVFIGKTLRVGGGQNMIEPAQIGRPVMVGPRTENFRGVMAQFRAHQAIVELTDESALPTALIDLIEHPEHRQALANSARAVVKRSQGATATIVDKIGEFVPRCPGQTTGP